MPNPQCLKCKTTESLLWRPRDTEHICHDCYLEENNSKLAVTSADNEQKGESSNNASTSKSTKKTNSRAARARNAAASSTPSTSQKNVTPRSRGRRSLFKRVPLKAPSATATIVTSDSVYYNGFYMQVGDIVSMMDENDDVYYAQIRGFLTDQYCEKSAVVTWLLPTKASPNPAVCFDPTTYIIGPEEDIPRKLSCMDFVMHAPSDYYKTVGNPYPPVESDVVSKALNGFIWTTLESQDRNSNQEEQSL